MLYPASPLPPVSVDAVQLNVALVPVTADTAGVPGVVGGVVSLDGSVENVTEPDGVDWLPAPSRARTRNTNCVCGVSPVRTTELVVDVAMTVLAALMMS